MKKASKRFWLFAFVFLFSLVINGSYIGYATLRTSKFIEVNEELNSLNYYVKQYLINFGDFVENAYLDQTFVKTGTSESLNKALGALDSARYLVDRLSHTWYADSKDNQQLLIKITASLNNNQKYSEEVAALFKSKGFKDLGLEGEMRTAIHNIEHYPIEVNLESLLTLRRHEKDFLLRKDEGYIKKFNDEISSFKESFTTDDRLSSIDKEALNTNLDKYNQTFNKIVEIEKKIGFNKSSGLKLLVRNEHSNFEALYLDMSQEIKEELKKLSNTTYIILAALLIMLIFLLSFMVVATFYYEKYISTPIITLEKSAAAVASGNLRNTIDAENSSRLLMDVFFSFNKIIEKIKLTISQIEDIANRKIKEPLPLSGENDDIGISLNLIIEQIKQYDAEEAIRRWETEGIALFSTVVRGADNLKTLCEITLPKIVKYIDANQAGLFVVNKDENKLSLLASYAYGRKKFLEKEINIGEGLVGQAYLEKDPIYITEIPEGYTHITSGMGDACPKALLIVPFMVNKEVEAILEIANFKGFQPSDQQFLVKIGEIIASAISSIRTKENTTQLLERYNQFSLEG